MLSAKTVAQKPVGSVRPPLSPAQLEAAAVVEAGVRVVSVAAVFLSVEHAAAVRSRNAADREALIVEGGLSHPEYGEFNHLPLAGDTVHCHSQRCLDQKLSSRFSNMPRKTAIFAAILVAACATDNKSSNAGASASARSNFT